MAVRTTQFGTTIARTAEQVMRKWAMGLEIKQRTEQEEAVAQLPQRCHPYVALSREAGAGGGEVARLVGQRLGWDVLNRELLHYIAEQRHLPRYMLEFVDETNTSWLFEVFGKWLNQRVVTQSEYVTHLGHAVLLAAHHGSVVFVGRGAQFVLPRERGVTAQIVAPREQRIERIMQRDQLSRSKAEAFLERTDHARQDFIQRYFHHEVMDPHLYDFVINLERVSQDDAASLIVAQVATRFGGGLSQNA